MGAKSSSERKLDPAEVWATLPTSMQLAFEGRDIVALDAALAGMSRLEAEMHMKRGDLATKGARRPG